MKFRSNSQAPLSLNRRDRYRLLVMVGGLCLVLVAVEWAARPSSWNWLAPPAESGAEAAPSLEELDFRVKSPRAEPLDPDTFRAVAGSDHPSRKQTADDGGASPDISDDLLATIEDNTLGLRRKEAAAYEGMLSRVDRLSPAAIARHSRDDVAFTVLMQEPDEFRGQLITVEGDLRRLTEIPAGEQSGFDKLYEGWLFTRDSGNNPYRIVFTRPVEGVELSESIDPPLRVRAQGYFFKRYGYASQGGQHIAPMLIAKSLTAIPRPATVPADGRQLRIVMAGVVTAVTLGLAALGLWWLVSDRRFRRSRLQRLASSRLDARPEDLASLQQAEVRDPNRPFDS